MNEQRLRRYCFSPHILRNFLFNPGAFEVLKSDVPLAARVVGASYNEQRHSFEILLQHESFDIVPIGETIPEGAPVEYRTWDRDKVRKFNVMLQTEAIMGPTEASPL